MGKHPELIKIPIFLFFTLMIHSDKLRYTQINEDNNTHKANPEVICILSQNNKGLFWAHSTLFWMDSDRLIKTFVNIVRLI